MKYMILLLVLLSTGVSQGALAASCGGLLVPLDELKYMDADELQRDLCYVPKYHLRFLRFGDFDNISACTKFTNLATKVLKREHGVEPLNILECDELLK